MGWTNHGAKARCHQCAVEIVREFFEFKIGLNSIFSSLDAVNIRIAKLSELHYLTLKN